MLLFELSLMSYTKKTQSTRRLKKRISVMK